MNVVQIDGSYATIDTVVPSLMQLELSLDKVHLYIGGLKNIDYVFVGIY